VPAGTVDRGKGAGSGPSGSGDLDNLASLLLVKRDYLSAEQLPRRALSIQEKSLGLEYPATARVLNELALVLKAQSNYAAAERLFRRALAIQERALGANHPDVAIVVVNNLGGITV
jgi:tetratricopeptide (TPR) repeat protein